MRNLKYLLVLPILAPFTPCFILLATSHRPVGWQSAWVVILYFSFIVWCCLFGIQLGEIIDKHTDKELLEIGDRTVVPRRALRKEK